MDNKIIEKRKINRRGFLQTTALSGGAAFLVGIPVLSYIIAPAIKKSTGKWVEFGPAEALQENTFNMLSYEFMVKDGWQVLPSGYPVKPRKLQETLESRKVIDRAKGVLMQRGMDEPQAFRRLQKLAMDKRKSLREVAEAILLTAE